MLVKKDQAKRLENSPDCTVWEYQYPSKLFNAATARIHGRYPEKGRVTNIECEEIYFVISGSGIVHSEKGDFRMEEGDLYFFEKGEVYWVEGDNLYMLISNAPPFDPEQHKLVD